MSIKTPLAKWPLCYSCEYYKEETHRCCDLRVVSYYCQVGVPWGRFQDVRAGLASCPRYKPKEV